MSGAKVDITKRPRPAARETEMETSILTTGLNRRAVLRGLGAGGAAAATLGLHGCGAGSENVALSEEALPPLLLHNNENPLGPGSRTLDVMRAALGEGAPAGRYPFAAGARDLIEAAAEVNGVATDHVMIGNGSTQLLRTATHVFTAPDKHLVMGAPSYEECPGYADLVGHPIVSVPLTDNMQFDLDGMAEAVKGAGMVFLCNPNNPTAALLSADAVVGFVETVLGNDPDVMIFLDEAYHDYVTDSSYASQIPLAVNNPRVVVSRTFSKAHGMAGMRIGYAIGVPDTLRRMRNWHYGMSVNVLALAAAAASLRDEERLAEERDRNTEAKRYTLDWFASHGHEATDSQTNFIFVNTGMTAAAFRAGCGEHGILVGRNFPPYENSYARISIGTIDQMRRATAAFGEVLGVSAVA